MLVRKNDVSFDVVEAPFWQVVNDGTWERETFDIFDRYLDKEHSYLDIGAWIGPTVLYGAHLAKHVYAYEPDEVALAMLHKNLALNQLENVTVSGEAVNEVSGEAKLGKQGAYGDSMSSFLWSAETKPVRCVSFASILAAHPDVNFIKMDIEGGEQKALQGAQSWLKRNHPTLYLSLHTPWIADKQRYLREMRDILGCYRFVYDQQGKPFNLADIHSNEGFTAYVATNVV